MLSHQNLAVPSTPKEEKKRWYHPGSDNTATPTNTDGEEPTSTAKTPFLGPWASQNSPSIPMEDTTKAELT